MKLQTCHVKEYIRLFCDRLKPKANSQNSGKFNRFQENRISRLDKKNSQMNNLSDQRHVGPTTCRTNDMSDQRHGPKLEWWRENFYGKPNN